MNVIAFDLGASTGRALEVNLSTALTVRELHRFDTPGTFEEGFERWNVSQIVEQLRRSLHEGANARCIAVDTWGVDFGLLDEAGSLVANPIRYRDASHAAGLQELERRVPREDAFRRTGIQPWVFNTASQLLARSLRGDRELKSAATLAMMPDLIAGRLCAEPWSPFAERTIASTSQLMGLDGDWDGALCEAAEVADGLLPPISPAGAIRGRTAEGVPVIATAGHDTACAVAAAPLRSDGEAFLSSGTWSLLGTESDTALASPEALHLGITNERTVDGRFRVLKNIMGLWLLQACQGARTAEECVALAERARPFVAKFDPNHPSLLNPPDMPSAIRSLCDAEVETEGELYRCIFENLAAEYARTLRSLERLTGSRFTAIRVVGGGARNSLLNQMTADAAGVPVYAGPYEATAIGNGLVQFAALGELPMNLQVWRDLVARSFPSAEFLPREPGAWSDWQAE